MNKGCFHQLGQKVRSLLLCLACVGLEAAQASPLDTWRWRNPLPQGHSLLGAAYANGMFVGVGEFGTILTSRDGSAWEIQNSGTIESLRSLASGNGTLVAVGGGLVTPTIVTSRDGTTWTKRNASDAHELFDVAFGNGTFVAVGSQTLYSSRDGVAWTQHGTFFFSTFEGVAYGNGTFVAVGTRGAVATSTDGSSWNSRSSTVSSDFQSVAYGGSTFVAVGASGTITTSPNGITWTRQISGTAVSLNRILHAGGTFMIVGASGVILTSPDGINWTKQSAGTDSDLAGVANGNGLFAAVGALGAILTSPDALSWTRRDSGPRHTLAGATYGRGRFVAVGSAGAIQTSVDGANWQGQISSTTNDLFGVVQANNSFVAVGNGGAILTSGDGASWTARTSGISNSTFNKIRAVTYGNGTFVAVGETIPVLTSADGIGWRSQAGGGNFEKVGGYSLYSVAYGNGLFVAVGYTPIGAFGFNSRSGSILTSPDGANWTLSSLSASSTRNSFTSVIFANGTFLVSGDLGAILTSTNGITWTDRSPVGAVGDRKAIAFGGGSFVAVGNSGSILSSADAVTWTNRSSGTRRNLQAVAFGGDTFVAVGDLGTILQSDALSSMPALPPRLDLTPGVITNDYPGKVTVTISGLKPGQTAKIETFLDENNNGQIDRDEPLIQSIAVADGVLPYLNGLRNTNVPGDEDGATNGQVRVELDFARRSEIEAVASSYAYKVSSSANAFTPVTAPFAIQQKAYPQGVSGSVTVAGGATAIPGVLVALYDLVANKITTSGFSDADGRFTLLSPPGAYLLLPLRRGYLGTIDFSEAAAANPGDLPLVFVRSGETLKKNLSLAAADRAIAGVVSDQSSGEGLAAVEVFASSFSTNSVVSFTFAITDDSGRFSLPVTSGSWTLRAEPRALARLRYLSLNDFPEIDARAGAVSGVALRLPKASALIYGRLANEQGNPLPGVNVTASESILGYETQTVSDQNGNFTLGVVAGEWSVGFDSQTSAALGYEMPGAEVRVSAKQNTQQDFVFKRSPTAGLVSIGSLIPDHGPPGTQVTLLGLNFTGATAVKFNGVDSAFTVDTPTQISTTVPKGATTGPITVVAPGGTAVSSDNFTIADSAAPPTILTQPVAQTVRAGASITFSIAATGAPPLSYQWRLDGVNLAGATNANLALNNVQPSAAGNYSVVISNPAGSVASAAALLTVLPTLPVPTLSSFSPSSGAPGMLVTIDGVNLSGIQEIKFGDTSAGFISLSEKQILTVVPADAVASPIQIIASGGTATSVAKFTVLASGNAPPTVRLDSPAPNQNFAANADIFVGATAHDGDGVIRHLDYYAGGTLIYGLDTIQLSTVQSSYTWKNVPAGAYTLKALTTDNQGARAISNPVTITVGAGPPLKIGRSGNLVMLAWPTNVVGFSLETSASLSAPILWTPVLTKPAALGDEFRIEEPASSGTRFFRLKR